MKKTAKAITLFESASSSRRCARWATSSHRRRADGGGGGAAARAAQNAARLNAIAEEITRLEDAPDDVYDAGMKALYHAQQGRPMDFIVGAEIYDHLEKVVDRFEDVANRISGILIEQL